MLSNQRWVSLFHTTAPSAVISAEALLPPKICIEISVSLPGCSRKKTQKVVCQHVLFGFYCRFQGQGLWIMSGGCTLLWNLPHCHLGI